MQDLVFGLHYLAFATALACLGVQLFCLSRVEQMRELRVQSLSRVDALYGIAALLTIATGLLRVFVFGKGPAYYATHTVFWMKVGLFAVIGALSVYPTLQLLRNRSFSLLDWRANRPATIRRIIQIIRIEILLYLMIPFLASALAHGPHF